ncbi:unnamed protein product, partial [Larinioides sclopetarius]
FLVQLGEISRWANSGAIPVYGFENFHSKIRGKIVQILQLDEEMDIKIRNATLSDLPSILDFAKSVGRFLGADEIKTWLQVDPEALFVAEGSPGGKLIGSCCATRLTPELGFMGLYVVLEEYRGRGIGSKLWRAAKEHRGDRNIGLHAELSMLKKYREREGFCHVEDY